MNKKKLFVGTLMLALMLSGCTKQDDRSAINVKAHNNSSTKVNKKVVEANNKKENSRLICFNKKIKSATSGILLPQDDGLKQGSSNLNMRFENNPDQSVVYYSVGESKQKFNDEILKKELPYAILTMRSNMTNEKMDKLIGYRDAKDDAGLRQIKLNDSITAAVDAGAGQQYLHFVKGNWSIIVHASSIMNQSAEKPALKLLNLIEKYGLPKTTGKSTIYITAGKSKGSLNNVFKWQLNDKYYQLDTHSLTTALKMLSSLE